jgi:hypothetical protein
MTPRRKANYSSHFLFFPAHGRAVSRTRRVRKDMLNSAHTSREIVTGSCPQKDGVQAQPNASQSAFVFRVDTRCDAIGVLCQQKTGRDGFVSPKRAGEQPARDSGHDRNAKPQQPSSHDQAVMLAQGPASPISAADTLPHCVSALQVRSTVLRGGVSFPNRARCRRCGQGEREEQLFFESRRARRPLDLVSRAWRSGRTSPQPFSRSAPDALSVPQTSTSAATASLPMKPSWSCSMSCGPASGLEEYPRGVRYSSQGSLRNGRRHFGADDRSLAALSARLVFSSGDGLGIQQPGSMTCGFASARQPASGRADESAKCPAVARFNDRRAA